MAKLIKKSNNRQLDSETITPNEAHHFAMETLSERVKKAIEPDSIRSFALKIDVSEGTLRRILKGEDPKLSVVEKIAEHNRINYISGYRLSFYQGLKQFSIYTKKKLNEKIIKKILKIKC